MKIEALYRDLGIYIQNDFAKIVEKIEILKTQYQKSKKELEIFYSSLSQKAFKGELDLSRIKASPFKKTQLKIRTSESIGSSLKKLNEMNSSKYLDTLLGRNERYVDAIESINGLTGYRQILAEINSPLEQLKKMADCSDLLEQARSSLSGKDIAVGRIILERQLDSAAGIAKELSREITQPQIHWLEDHPEALEIVKRPFDEMHETVEKLNASNWMEQYNETFESLNELNHQNTIDDLLGATQLNELTLNHKDMLLNLSEQMKQYESPFEQLNNMAELASSMTNASEMMNNLGVELSTLERSAEIARSLADAIPTAEIRQMEQNPVIQDFVEEAFASKQELLSQKFIMTSKELLKLMQSIKKPFKFQTLLNVINEDNPVDLDGYELIKSFLYSFMDDNILIQKYDTQSKSMVFECSPKEIKV
jgi:hypothetical protein